MGTGKKYDGDWHEGEQHGLGMCCSALGKVRLGEFKDGKRIRWIE